MHDHDWPRTTASQAYRTVRDQVRDAEILALVDQIPFTTTPSSQEGHDRVVGHLLLSELEALDGHPPIIYGTDDRIATEIDRYRAMIDGDEFYVVAREAEYGVDGVAGDIDVGVFHVEPDTVHATYIEAKSYPVRPEETDWDQFETFQDHADALGWEADAQLAFYDDESGSIYRCRYDGQGDGS